MVLPILIPSAGRAEQPLHSLEWLPRDRVHVVVRPSQRDAYLERLARDYPECRVLVLPMEATPHIGRTRKWIIEQMDEPFIMADDDLRLRRLDESKSVGELLDELGELLTGTRACAMTGFGQQFMGSIKYRTARVHYDQPVYMIQAVDPAHMRDVQIDDLPLLEDFEMNLHAVRARGTACLYAALVSTAKSSVGGCSEYRSPEMWLECLESVRRRWPGVVEIDVVKPTPHNQHTGRRARTRWRKIVRRG